MNYVIITSRDCFTVKPTSKIKLGDIYTIEMNPNYASALDRESCSMSHQDRCTDLR